MITTPSQIQLHTFPSDDAAFARFVRDARARLEAPDPECLQQSIRERYPLAIVRERVELARLSGDGIVWYVFRHALADPPDEPWWESEPAWATIAPDRTFVEASEAFAAIVEVPAAALAGRSLEDLANIADPTAADDVPSNRLKRSVPCASPRASTSAHRAGTSSAAVGSAVFARSSRDRPASAAAGTSTMAA
ncbi:MAG TPA: hypothetical protein VM344_09445, partial [Vitreimonas sp.]|nr:hypothetical protein [Vitreimonas sp.]